MYNYQCLQIWCISVSICTHSISGVCRQFVNGMWFNSANHASDWYLGGAATTMHYDTLLTSVKTPKEIRRIPRSITAREFWKGNEFKTFLLYLSMVSLRGILPNMYFRHWFLLVWCIHQLLQPNITLAVIEKVDVTLKYFVKKTELLYGIEFVTFNVHLLTHLASSVRKCGPLWSTSTFLFEGNNLVLGKLFKGTQQITHQICSSYSMMKTLPLYLSKYGSENLAANRLGDKLVRGIHHTSTSLKVSDKTVCFGKMILRDISATETIAARSLFDVQHINTRVQECHRFSISNKLFDSEKYKRTSKRQNRYIKASDKNDGRQPIRCSIKLLLVGKLCQCVINDMKDCPHDTVEFLMCDKLSTETGLHRDNNLNISTDDFMVQVTQVDSIIALHPENIITKCVQIEKDGQSYLLDVPNLIEQE